MGAHDQKAVQQPIPFNRIASMGMHYSSDVTAAVALQGGFQSVQGAPCLAASPAAGVVWSLKTTRS